PYFRAPHIYFSFPKRFVPHRKLGPEYPETGISEAVFLSSRDGIHFDRTFLEALIRPGRDPRNWGDRGQMPAWGLVQTGPDEMSLYYSRNYNFPTVHERRGVFRLDGIASAHAGYRGGELVTKLIKFKGNQLVLNFATAASGSVQVEIQDAEGTSLSGLSMNDAPELFGDEIAKAYAWSSKSTLGNVAGRPVRLRIRLKDADVFSYRFTP
ncbi:MAG: hypothetical protein MK538_08080, partial [Planctomycetes bacterium]|nr:hypothetical protein [Planctomycetota bacterium]